MTPEQKVYFICCYCDPKGWVDVDEGDEEEIGKKYSKPIKFTCSKCGKVSEGRKQIN